MNNDYSNLRKKCKIIHLSDENIGSSSSRQPKSARENIYTKNAYIYGWGKNKYGELGLGTLSDVYIPSPIILLESQLIHSIKPGGRNTIILSSDNMAYTCGSNIFGLLVFNSNSQNNEQKQKIFKKIKYFSDNEIIIKDISLAEFHCLALDEKGKIYGWGGNLFNKLGRKYDILTGIPNQILIKNKIISISCGDYHSCALSEEGFLYSWGGGGESYNKGQCGHGTNKDVQKPKKIEFFIKNNLKIKKVSCGGYHTIVIADTDELYSFGKGLYGQCGYGQPENISTPKKVYFNENQNLKYENNKKIFIIDIKCGGEHSLFLSSNKNVYTCGHGYLGQLGLGNNKNINLPTIVQSLTNKKIIEIAAGWSHSLVLTSEGNIYSTGCNKYGELGIGKDFNKYNYTWIKCLSKLNIKNISAGGHHSWCLIDSNNPLKEGNNNPEPLLKSNFTMYKKIKRKYSEKDNENLNNSSFHESRWNKKNNNTHNKSSISADTAIRRKNNNSEGNDFNRNNIRKDSQKKIKQLIDNYNNNENDMSIDKLIENINKIDNYQNNIDNPNDENDEDKKKYIFNSKDNINNLTEDNNNIINDDENLQNQENKDDSNNDDNNIYDIKNINDRYYSKKENNNDNDNLNDNNYNNNIINNNISDNDTGEEKDKLIYNNIYNYYNNEYDNNNIFCELKIVYCDLNLSHRFIRFQSSIEYNKLYNIIKNNYIDKDIGIISFQFQRDDEIENNNSNNSISSEIKYIFNKMKNEKLINLDKLSRSYTLGLVYDYNKNENIKQLKDKIELNNINNKENIGPFAGIKNINSKEILNSDFEIILSKWIIDFYEIYNNFLEIKENKGTIDTISFFELRPKYLNI